MTKLEESNYYKRLRSRLLLQEKKDIQRQGFVIRGRDLSKSDATSCIAFRSDRRSPKEIFVNGFYSKTTNFDTWEIRLGLGPDGLWQNFKRSKAGAVGTDREEINQMMIKKDQASGNIDIDDLSCVSLTTRASIAPTFPCFTSTPEEHLGTRWLYAVYLDTYFDAHAFEKQENPNNPAVQYNEIAVHDIPRGHILAAIECNVIKRADNTIRYEAFDKPILWNTDTNDMLRGVPRYREQRKIVEDQFCKLSSYEYLDIHVKSSEKITVMGSLPNNQPRVASKKKSSCPSFFDETRQKLITQFPLKTRPDLLGKDYKKQFKDQLLQELERVAKDKQGQIDAHRQSGIDEVMKHKSIAELYENARKMVRGLDKTLQELIKKDQIYNTMVIYNHKKNIKIILKEFYQNYQEEKNTSVTRYCNQ